MIVVIADDLTGAAEIGGIGLQFQMKVEIGTTIHVNTDADLYILATDIRSQTNEQTKETVKEITHQLGKLKNKPAFIYAKTDSVLRGPVVAELKALMDNMDRKKALLVPANPHLGRIIKEGVYYVNGEKIQETGFKNDPELATSSSFVKDLLNNNEDIRITIAGLNKCPSEDGIIIGEASSINDLNGWAAYTDDNTVIAGAAGYFLALIQQKTNYVKRAEPKPVIHYGEKKLFVCGSAFSSSRAFIKETIRKGGTVSLMPACQVVSPNNYPEVDYQKWAEEVITLYKKSDAVIVAANPDIIYDTKSYPELLRHNMAQTVKRIMDIINIQELLIEGGATASAVLEQLNYNFFYPKEEIAYGVIRMAIPDNEKLHITLKPGSYRWPDPLRPV